MIRVPFFSPRESSTDDSLPAPAFGMERTRNMRQRAELLELRLVELESRLAEHAEAMRMQLVTRVTGIQHRVESALRPFEADAQEENMEVENVLNFSSSKTSPHHLHATNTAMALNELNRTLQHMREHLDALNHSISRIRSAVEKGKSLASGDPAITS